MTRCVLAVDVGGANLKAAHSGGGARLQPFELWKNPSGLANALARLLATFPVFDLLAVTMTGELCDCFESKRQGVQVILDAVAAVAGRTPVRIWRNDGRLVDLAEARSTPLPVAAANWLALATFAGRYAPTGPGLLLDVGSTTTDIVPLMNGKPVPSGRDDPQRLRAQELVYTGVRRTPLCAILGDEAAAELFATALDVYLVFGVIPEDAADCSTADGRPATRASAHARLARMLCADLETCSEEERRDLCLKVLNKQTDSIGTAVAQVANRLAGIPQTVVVAGSGEWLGRKALRRIAALAPAREVRLAVELGREISHAACAYALAVLAAEEVQHERNASCAPLVVKVGGSLFDLPDLGQRLRHWLRGLATGPILLVPGGGAAADAVRDLDRRHGLGDEAAHWLALRALSLNAQFLAALLSRIDPVVIEGVEGCRFAWQGDRPAIVDGHAFARADEGRPGCLPHSWAVTSDSLAARVAVVLAAPRLVLLKSITIPQGMSWMSAAERGFVDGHFPQAVGAAPPFEVRALNFREGSR